MTDTKKEFHGVYSNGTGFKLVVLEGSEDESLAAPESDVPCLGSWHHGVDGSDFDCDYNIDFGCDECVVNGGDRDPRQESADQDIVEDFERGVGPLRVGVDLVALHLGYVIPTRPPFACLEANGLHGEWCLENVRGIDGEERSHDFTGICRPEFLNPVAALREILAEPPFCDMEKFKVIAAQIAPVKSETKSPEVKPCP